MDDSVDARLARNLMVAYVATQMGVTLATAERRYGDQKPGPVWLALADHVRSEATAAVNQTLESLDTPPGIPHEEL